MKKYVTNVHVIGNKNEIYIIWRNHKGLTISLMGSLIDCEKKNKSLILLVWLKYLNEAISSREFVGELCLTVGYARGERDSEEHHVQIYEAQDQAIANRNAATPDVVQSSRLLRRNKYPVTFLPNVSVHQ